MQYLATMTSELTLPCLTEMVDKGAAEQTHPAIMHSIAPMLAPLSPTKMGTRAKDLEMALRQRISGHQETISEIVTTYQTHLAGLSADNRPLGAFLFVGPAGSGKMRTVEAVAEALLGNPHAVTKIRCAEFRHSYDITRLIGLPRTDPKDRQNRPLLTQEIIERHCTRSAIVSVVVFDEIDKASQALWNRLLGILDTGMLILGDDRKVDFSRALIFLTSTAGTDESDSRLQSKLAVYDPGLDEPGSARPVKTGQSRSTPGRSRRKVEAAHRELDPDFLNRLDGIEMFRGLAADRELGRVVESEIQIVQQRLHSSPASSRCDIYVTESARQFLVAEAGYFRYGTERLKRAIERALVRPLSNLITTGQIHNSDRLRITHIGASPALTFFREENECEMWGGDEGVA